MKENDRLTGAASDVQSDSLLLRVAGAVTQVVEAKQAVGKNGNPAAHDWADRSMQNLVNMIAKEPGAVERLRSLQNNE